MKNSNKALEILSDNNKLESNRLILRSFRQEDYKDVFQYAKDDKVTEFLTWESINTEEEAKDVITNIYKNSPGVFAIELKDENKCIGCIDLRLNLEYNKANFGYVLNREYWNKGYMTEALNLLLEFSFRKLKLNRIEGTYYLGNDASGKVMEKVGMRYEGKGIEEVFVKNIYRDVIHYGITNKMFEEQRKFFLDKAVYRY